MSKEQTERARDDEHEPLEPESRGGWPRPASLRNQFAMAALATCDWVSIDVDPELVSRHAFRIADALMRDSQKDSAQ